MQDALVIRSLAGTLLVLALVVGLLVLAGCMKKAGKRDTQGVRALPDQGADVKRQFGGSDGRSALHHAARTGQMDTIRALLQRGDDPNAKDRVGQAPLHLAAWQGHEEVVRLLLQYGADPKAVDNNRNTPAEVAKAYGHKSVAALLEASSSVDSPAPSFRSPPPPASQSGITPPPIY